MLWMSKLLFNMTDIGEDLYESGFHLWVQISTLIFFYASMLNNQGRWVYNDWINELAISLAISVLFYLLFSFYLAWVKRAGRVVAWIGSEQLECTVPSVRHAESSKFGIGIFVEQKAPGNFCGLFFPISNPEKNRLRPIVSIFFPNLFKVFYHWVSQKGKHEWLWKELLWLVHELSLKGELTDTFS